MALSVKVGSLTAPAGTGNQSYTGIGFQPKVVIFFGNGATADGMGGSASSDPAMPIYLGFGVGTTYGVLLDDDDFTSGDPWEQNTACIEQQYSNANAGTIHIKASMVSLDADGFTLNWANTTSGMVVNYLALGGAELSASVVHPTVPTATGAWAITGAGFQPDAAIVLLGSNAYSGSDSMAGFGFVSKQGATVKQGCATTAYNAGSSVYQRTDQSIALVNGGSGKVFEASHTSMDAGGMTLNVTTLTGGASLQASVLFLKGVQIRSDAIIQKTSTGTQAYTGYGFQPKALLFGGSMIPASTAVQTNGLYWMFGATDGTNRGVVAKRSETNGSHVLDRTKVYKWPSDSSTPTVLAAADLSTFDADGFTLNFTTADAVARQSLVMAFGDPAGSGAQNVSVAGLASQQAFGTVTPVPGPVSIPITGLASEQAFGAVSIHGAITVPVAGLASEQAFSSVSIHGSVVVPVSGLASEQAFGAVTIATGPVTVPVAGLASEQAFGSVNAGGGTMVSVPGLASEQAFGSVTPVVGPVSVPVPGLGSEQAFGTPIVQGGIGPSFGPAQMGRHIHR